VADGGGEYEARDRREGRDCGDAGGGARGLIRGGRKGDGEAEGRPHAPQDQGDRDEGEPRGEREDQDARNHQERRRPKQDDAAEPLDEAGAEEPYRDHRHDEDPVHEVARAFRPMEVVHPGDRDPLRSGALGH
jgi:hypothetical protein